MIRHLFLDLDDTVLDFHSAERAAISESFREVGVEPTERILTRYSEINRLCWKRLERGELTRSEVLLERFRLLYRELALEASPERTQEIYEYRLSLEHPFMEGGLELLEKLLGRYKLYIASNGTARVQDRRIADTGIAHFFDGIFISERVGFDKPKKEFFDFCLKSIGNPERDECMIIGDSLTSDIQGGKNAGILTCHFNPRAYPAESGIKPDYEIRTLGELPRLLERI
ncbi:MAG: YjjG family noncanonical pyrimidine nucleotidase [Clostridia bacterium]|nr:YjjG family noncanonical pyrimidine nucleotidase [Clostridia bacterium]